MPEQACPNCGGVEWFPGAACWHCGWEASDDPQGHQWSLPFGDSKPECCGLKVPRCLVCGIAKSATNKPCSGRMQVGLRAVFSATATDTTSGSTSSHSHPEPKK